MSDEGTRLDAGFWGHIDGLSFAAEKLQFPPVRTQFYGHGAFMGAVHSLLADEKWRRILGFLMPDVFEALRAKIAEGSGVASLIPMTENNPVLAAYGTVRTTEASSEQEHPNHLVGIEWDLFVDASLIEAVASATTPEALTLVLDQVLDTALIAHGGAIDVALESIGASVYASVRETPKSEFGGVEMDAWLDLFGRALALARSERFAESVAEMASEPRSASTEACMLHTFAAPWPLDRVVKEFEHVTGRPYISIIIDIKSLSSTPAFLTAVVGHLNRLGIHIAAIGSFLLDEIRGVAATPQPLGALTLPGPREVLFFHVADDVLKACAEAKVPDGQSVLFNGASLVNYSNASAGHYTYAPKSEAIEQLEAARKRHALQLGIYVQEGDCEAACAKILSEITEAWPETFGLGFAWGGLRDEAGLAGGPVARAGYGAQILMAIASAARPLLEEEA